LTIFKNNILCFSSTIIQQPCENIFCFIKRNSTLLNALSCKMLGFRTISYTKKHTFPCSGPRAAKASAAGGGKSEPKQAKNNEQKGAALSVPHLRLCFLQSKRRFLYKKRSLNNFVFWFCFSEAKSKY